MATAAMATAAGAAALLYYALGRRAPELEQDSVQEGQPSSSSGTSTGLGRKRIMLGPSRRAPSTWFEAITTLSETLRFTYAETLGKWPIVDLAFGINFLMKRQGHLQIASIYSGEGSLELRGEVLAELKELLILLTACIHFSKKPFQQFLEASGYSQDCVLLQEPKAGLLKPAFAILVDKKLQCILLLIRGTHSVKDTLTAVTGAVVPFHHTLLDDGGISNLVLGYAHCGMVAAARWISQLATPILLQAQKDHPTYTLKIVGHSLGGGTAALLTYILRERKDFSSVHCVCFAPAACMTWELAESGKPFTTSVIHGADLVPTFSAASMDDLRSEVTASAWVSDFREQIERIRFLKTVLRSTSALSNRLSSIASASRPFYPYLGGAAKAGVATAWRPVSNGTQVVMKQAQNVVQAVVRTRPSLGLAGWSCMGARRRTVSNMATPSHLHGTGERVEGLLQDQSKDAAKSGNVSLNEVKDILQKERNTETWIATASWNHSEEESVLSEKENENCSRLSNEMSQEQYLRDDPVTHDEHKLGIEIQHYQQDGGDGDGDGDDDDELPISQKTNDTAELREEYLWQQLERELERQTEACIIERQEEEEEAKKIIQEEEENVAAAAAEIGSDCIVTEPENGKAPGRELNRFFPPGRIIHLLSFASEKNNEAEDENAVTANLGQRPMPQAGLYMTDRALYGKVHLSRNMINDHYMPSYKRIIEVLIGELEGKKLDGYTQH